jgi:hypothetical protein
MKSKILQWSAVALIMAIGVLHLLTAQAEYEEAAYMGYLFAANFFGALSAAFGIYHQQVWGWLLGLLIAVGSLAGYIWSRTVGMPGMAVEEWINPYGVVALTVESLFILLVFMRPWRIVTPAQLSIPAWCRYMVAAAAMLVALLAVFLPYQWDAALSETGPVHTVSIEKLRTTPPTSFKTLEEQYGVQVSLVAVTALNGIVDVRLKILDVDRANQLFKNHGALLVGETLILPPHMHGRHTLKQGKPYIVFYPNQQHLVQAGTPVSLVFGDMHSEPIAAQ